MLDRSLSLPARWQTFGIGGFMVAIALAVTWQFLALPGLPVTPHNDLAMHTALVENFAAALTDGQWLPRLQNRFGAPFDVPLFQYYGFMTGLSGSPFLLAGLPAFTALILAVIGWRAAGSALVYACARRLGGGRPAALLAAAAFQLTPYLITNLYGRVDVAETIAHNQLPLLVLGLLTGLQGSFRLGTALIALGVVLLAFTHPIFLLYGTLGMGVMALATPSRRSFALVGLGAGIGLLLAGIQWIPAFLTSDLLGGHFLKYSPFETAAHTSAAGLYGLPLSQAERGWMAEETPYVYLTPGWLTVPVLVGLLVIRLRGSRMPQARMAGLVLFPGALYLFLAFSPVDVFQFMPRMMWALQFPYRLLGFVALFTALALPLVRPRLTPAGATVLIALCLVQSGLILTRPTYTDPLPETNDKVATRYASTDYVIVNPAGLTRLKTFDGWLHDYARPFYVQGLADLGENIADEHGWLRTDNRLSRLSRSRLPIFLRLTGTAVIPGGGGAKVWLATPERPEQPVSEVRPLAAGPFAVILTMPRGPTEFQIMTDPPLAANGDGPGVGLRLDLVESLPQNPFRRGLEPARGVIHLSGTTVVEDQPTELWVALPSAPEVPLTGKIALGPGPFDVSVPLPAQPGLYMLVPSRSRIPAVVDSNSSDRRRLSLKLTNLEVLDAERGLGEQMPRIPERLVGREATGGWSRRFQVLDRAGAGGQGPWLVELPIAYNPFFRFDQGGDPVSARANDSGRAVVILSNLTAPITARYAPPWVCWIALAGGIIVLAMLRRLEAWLRIEPVGPAKPAGFF